MHGSSICLHSCISAAAAALHKAANDKRVEASVTLLWHTDMCSCLYVCMYVCMFCLSWARLRSFAQVNGLFVTDLFRSALTIYAGMYVCTNECIIARHDACVAQSLMLDVDNENAAAAAAIAEVLEFSCEAALCFKSPVDKESKIILEKFHIVT